MTLRIDQLFDDSLPSALRQPSIIMWNRLEPRPRTDNFERSLRAEVRDALWMLTRQWQLGEFQGDDAGSAVQVEVTMETTPITHYAPRPLAWQAYDATVPLEATVEREPEPLDLLLRLQMGQHWLRLLQAQNLPYRALFCQAFPIASPQMSMATGQPIVADAQLLSNRPAWQMQITASGRTMDGGAFYLALKHSPDKIKEIKATIAEQDQSKIEPLVERFVTYYDKRLLTQPAAQAESAWEPERLEYQFRCAAPSIGREGADGKHTVLAATEYCQGHLDWYSFDIAPDAPAPQPETQVNQTNVVQTQTMTFLPAEARFAGMPNRRWWEFEDRRVDFGDIDAHTTDLAKLLVIEFGLIFSNDWLVVPYPLKVGSLATVKHLIVTDVFGQKTEILAAGAIAEEYQQRWRMFNLSHADAPTGPQKKPADQRLFLPPVVGQLLESPPVEKVTFLRDEMSNLVWAVEGQIPNELGGGMDGNAAEQAVRTLLTPPQPNTPTDEEASTQLRYILGTTVPENWIPFVPINLNPPESEPKIRLQRAAMPRPDAVTPEGQIVQPRGLILRPNPASTEQGYYIFEEEVPRAGAIVTRSYQRTRWSDGNPHLWLGRRKQAGRGEGSSGLKFDQLEGV